MGGAVLLTLALAIVVATAVVFSAARSRKISSPSPDPLVRSLMLAARRRALTAVAVAFLVFATLVAYGTTVASTLGVPALVSATWGATAGLLVYAAVPPQAVPVSDVREATLVPRTPFSFVQTGDIAAFGALVLTQIGLLVFTGLSAQRDSFGLFRAVGFETATHSSGSSPYAGWFYGVPLLVSTSALLIATIVALVRVSATPALPTHALSAADAHWRRRSNRIVLAIASAAVLLSTGAAATISGRALSNAWFEGIAADWRILGEGIAWSGVALLIGSVVALTTAALWALDLPLLASSRTQERTRAAA